MVGISLFFIVFVTLSVITPNSFIVVITRPVLITVIIVVIVASFVFKVGIFLITVIVVGLPIPCITIATPVVLIWITSIIIFFQISVFVEMMVTMFNKRSMLSSLFSCRGLLVRGYKEVRVEVLLRRGVVVMGRGRRSSWLGRVSWLGWREWVVVIYTSCTTQNLLLILVIFEVCFHLFQYFRAFHFMEVLFF